MSHKKLEQIRDMLVCTVETELEDLEAVDTCELGEVIDMIKDLNEAIYYETVTKAMNEQEWDEYKELKKNDLHHMNSEGHQSAYEGRSHMSRKMYMEAREMNKDKTAQLRELEKYMQELSSDITEMIADASPEEKQYLEKKITALASKIGQMK